MASDIQGRGGSRPGPSRLRHPLGLALSAALISLPGAPSATAIQKAPLTGTVELTLEERAWLASHGPIRLVTEPAFPPVEWFDEQGRYRGMVAEYLEIIEARLGVPVEVERAPSWDEAMRRARAQEVDGLTAAQSTPERASAFDWTPPVLQIPSVIIVRAGAAGEFTLESMEGKLVAVSSGNALHEHLRIAHPRVHAAPQPDDLSALLAVSFGRADAALVNLAVASYLIEQKGINNLRVAADSGRTNTLSIATGKHHPLLGSIMAKGLAAVTSGEREAIHARWLHVKGGHFLSGPTLARWGAATLGALLLTALLAVAWTRTLRRKITLATGELRAVLDAVPTAVFIARDREAREVNSNRSGAEMLRASGGSFKAMKDGVEVPREQLPVQMAASQGREIRDFQFDVVQEDGTVRNLIGNATPIRNRAGGPAGAVAAFVDVTELKQAEIARRRSEARFRSLIENAVDMIVVLDRDGRIRFASPSMADILGRPSDSMVGESLFAFVHLDESQTLRDAFASLVASPGATTRYEARFPHRDGSWRLAEGLARNLLEDPAVQGVVINARDVTDQRRLEEAFHHAQKLESVGRLAGGVAHDFNNLLTVILSGVHDIRHDLDAGVPIDRTMVEDIGEAGERARILTNQLLAFARKQVVAPVALDLNEVLGRSEGVLRRMLGEDIDLRVDLQPGLWTTLCDPGQVEQVVLNLAVNARDAMPDGGTLAIETRNAEVGESEARRDRQDEVGQWVRMYVRDSGTGMSPEVVSHLFEPFFTTKARGKGTGLGLATVHGIVHQAGGHIHVHSEPGRGTTFEVCLPRRVGSARAPVERHGPVAVGGTETVLVVEDEPVVRELTARALRNNGYQVLVAGSGQEALELDEDQVSRVQLLVTDVIMPGIGGRKMAEEMRRRQPGLAVLFVSGYAADAFTDGSALDGRSGFLSKPFSAPVLLGKVREVLDRS